MKAMAGLGIALVLVLSADASAQPKSAARVSIVRLDCGNATVKNFDAFFSDTHEYPVGPRKITSSCYVVRHGRDVLLWDTGFPAALKGKTTDMGALIVRVDRTIPEQLAILGLKPSDIGTQGPRRQQHVAAHGCAEVLEKEAPVQLRPPPELRARDVVLIKLRHRRIS